MADDAKQGAYAPPPDDFDTFDARYGEGARRGPLILLVVAVLIVLVVALAWSSYNLGVRDRNGPPVITADAGPFRTAPDDPGGMEVAGADLDVFELRDPETEAQAVPVGEGRELNARPAPEEPAPLALEGAAQTPPAVEATIEDLIEAPSAAADTPVNDPQPADPPAPEPATSAAPEPAPVRPDPVAEPAPSTPPLVEASDGWRVQISAHRSQEEADGAWIDFVAAYPDLARGRAPEIVRADLGERGVYYRLRVTTAPSREAATRYCDILRGRGQDCLVVQG